MATYNACQTEYYLDWKNGGVKLELDRKTKHVCRISGGLTQSSVGGVSTHE